MKTLRYIIIIIIHKQLIVIPEIMNIPETETDCLQQCVLLQDTRHWHSINLKGVKVSPVILLSCQCISKTSITISNSAAWETGCL